MTPTMHLRFVEKDMMVPHPTEKNVKFVKTLKVLQQKWEKKQWAHDDWIVVESEWRDVPLEQL